MESSIRSPEASGRSRLTRYEAHPFEAPPEDAEAELCALCGERRVHILHHPTRIRAACLLRGLDPDAVLRGRRG